MENAITENERKILIQNYFAQIKEVGQKLRQLPVDHNKAMKTAEDCTEAINYCLTRIRALQLYSAIMGPIEGSQEK